MKTKFIEAMHEHGAGNWGKFMVGRFDEEEWERESEVVKESLDVERLSGVVGKLLAGRGWSRQHLLVLDLATGEGALFMATPRGHAGADLDKHRVWVCPLFEPFLRWLYAQDLSDLDKLPGKVVFTRDEADFEMRGYRRSGPMP